MKQFINIAIQPIADRLNSAAPGADLDPQDAYAIMHLCPFETVAKEKISPFCLLFSKNDFKMYEYAGDLEKFYNTGYASHLPFAGTHHQSFIRQARRSLGSGSRGRVRQRTHWTSHKFPRTPRPANEQHATFFAQNLPTESDDVR